jgi:hypothetical protein
MWYNVKKWFFKSYNFVIEGSLIGVHMCELWTYKIGLLWLLQVQKFHDFQGIQKNSILTC